MNKNELVKLCLIDDAVETHPFKEKQYSELIVMRHKSNNKWFALIFNLEDKLYINLKCNPVDCAVLKDEYPFITPAWHMNKKHWIKIDVEKAPEDILKALIKTSFDLTQTKR